MYANYHSHTYRCHHATGTEEEYIIKAIDSGLKIFGFSDHSPYTFDDDRHYSMRMRPENCKEYTDTILNLREKYKNKIKIHIGYEVEYYPDKFNSLLDTVKQFPCDYLILGQHFINSDETANVMISKNDDEKQLIRYTDTIIEGMKTGKFIYVAHPDAYNFCGNPDVYKRELLRICKASKELNIPTEINLLGLGDNRKYPTKEFFGAASEVGNKVIFGSDAHHTEYVFRPDVVKKAEQIVKNYGLNLIDELEI